MMLLCAIVSLALIVAPSYMVGYDAGLRAHLKEEEAK